MEHKEFELDLNCIIIWIVQIQIHYLFKYWMRSMIYEEKIHTFVETECNVLLFKEKCISAEQSNN